MKYPVAPVEDRTWHGRTYGSKAEMLHAQQLRLRLAQGDLVVLLEQPRLWLGVPENVYVPDFFTLDKDGVAEFVDVKGVETPKFKRDKKLWKSYGMVPLRIVRKGRTVAVVDGGGRDGTLPTRDSCSLGSGGC